MRACLEHVLHSGLNIESGFCRIRLDCIGLDAKALKFEKALCLLRNVSTDKALAA